MGSADEAIKLRRKFGKLPIADRKRHGVRLMNSVTPSTRVRISILKSISIAYKSAYPDFTSAVTGLDLKALGLTDSDFQKAYQIAGRKFFGEMSAFFIVLKDDSPLCVTDRPDGRKRNAEESPAPNPSRRPHLSDSMDVAEV